MKENLFKIVEANRNRENGVLKGHFYVLNRIIESKLGQEHSLSSQFHSEKSIPGKWSWILTYSHESEIFGVMRENLFKMVEANRNRVKGVH